MSNKFKNHNNSTNVRINGVSRKTTRLLLNFAWKTVPGITKQVVADRFFAPTRSPCTPSEKNWLEIGETFQIRVNHRTIQCWKWGQGPAILFVHGWNGRGIHFHTFFDRLITAGYAVLTFDGPAHGESEGKSTSYFEFTDALRALIRQYGKTEIHGIIAHSFGAGVAVNTLVKENLSLATVLLAPALRLRETVFLALEHYGIPQPVYLSIIREAENNFGYELKKDDPKCLIQEIDHEIIMVHDTDDETIPYEDSKNISDEYINLKLLTTNGLGHKRILNDKPTVKLVLDYLLDRCAHLPRIYKSSKSEIGRWI